MARLGEKLDLSPEAAALGVVRVANAAMERALRRVSVEEGHDPRTYILVPFGGAGPLHACDLAAALGIRRLLVPPNPGLLSALGLLLADVVFDASQAVLQRAAILAADPEPLRAAFEGLDQQVRAVLHDHKALQVEAFVEARYAGQSYELEVPLALPLSSAAVHEAAAAFHTAHRQRYGYASQEAPVEVVTLRVRGTAPGARPALPREPEADDTAEVAHVGQKSIWFGSAGSTPTACYDRTRLRPGHHFAGPAVVFQYDTTLVVPPGWHARLDAWRNILLDFGS